jgi:hypothetical protein
MTSDEHLKQLLDLRGALLREVARLDVAITKECAQARMSPAMTCRGNDSLSWEDALHRAKIQPRHAALALDA